MTSPSQKLQKILNDHWQFCLKENPLFASLCGEKKYNHLLPAPTLENIEQQHQTRKQFLQQLQQIPLNSLTPVEQLNHKILSLTLQEEIESYQFKTYLMPFNNLFSFYVTFPQLPHTLPPNHQQDLEDLIQRYQAFYQYTLQNIQLAKEGLQQGYTIPQIALKGYETILNSQIHKNPQHSTLYQPFQNAPNSLAKEAANAIQNSVIPAYQKLLEFIKKEYFPKCRQTIAAKDLPNGDDYYRFCVRHYTTLNTTPEEVHQIGQNEVQRIRKEMNQIIQKLQFQGNFQEFLHFLRTDPQFHAKSEHELLAEISYILKKMDGELPRLFKTLPRMPYGIRPIPKESAPKAPNAYYMRPAGDGTRAGIYYVNTHQLHTRYLHEMEALALHEAVPGHHLQIALQQELSHLPPLRRFAGFTAYIEGWALYAEQLGKEVGFYQNPYNDFGRLTYEIWRACRLVVDTGIHYLNWSREQAIQFMTENTPLSPHNIQVEVDRYITWPGQALSYKMGELKIKQLRQRAQQELNNHFDIREFHDAILLEGAIPLKILEEQIQLYIQTKKSSLANQKEKKN